MNARYYEPETGRFINQDSYRGDGDAFWNLYAYCEADPVNTIDPTGHAKATVSEAQMGRKAIAETVLYLKFPWKGGFKVESYQIYKGIKRSEFIAQSKYSRHTIYVYYGSKSSMERWAESYRDAANRWNIPTVISTAASGTAAFSKALSTPYAIAALLSCAYMSYYNSNLYSYIIGNSYFKTGTIAFANNMTIAGLSSVSYYDITGKLTNWYGR